jgi:hypothetical protein
MRTREQVEHLKIDWKADPTWDIENTDGFEDYRDELRIYHENCIAKWTAEWTAEAEEHHAKLAAKFCPMKFANHITINWGCLVERCTWWNESEEKCAIRVLNLKG